MGNQPDIAPEQPIGINALNPRLGIAQLHRHHPDTNPGPDQLPVHQVTVGTSDKIVLVERNTPLGQRRCVGLVMGQETDERPLAERFGQRRWNRSAARYARRPIADQSAYLKKIALTQSYFRPDMDVLEFGCGTGSTAPIHAPKVRSYLATDASPRMIEIAMNFLSRRDLDTWVERAGFRIEHRWTPERD